jgi:hypothetical protein
MKASEAECVEALDAELSTTKRPQFALRLFCRLNRLRTIRERNEIMEKLKDGNRNS